MSIHTTNKSTKTQALNLYIHLPFCTSKCHYCAFYSCVSTSLTLSRYVNALVKEIKSKSSKYKQYQVSSIYLGGGTPSLLKPIQVKMLLETIEQYFIVDQNCEITLEANPDSLNIKKLTGYLNAGVNRLSIGLQSWQNRLLTYLGRSHTQHQFRKAFEWSRQVGFNNINVDCIFGIPNQSESDWQNTLEALLKLSPEHISCYSLELDNQSVFGSLHEHGLLIPTDESLDRRMYSYTKNKLTATGYFHYEISNFARPGFECKHNNNFWHHQDYLGFGAGAHSSINSQHFFYPSDLNAFILHPKISKEPIDNHPLEWLMLRLRLINGFLIKEYEKELGIKMTRKLSDKFKVLHQNKLVNLRHHRIKLTSKGLDLYDLVISQISAVV